MPLSKRVSSFILQTLGMSLFAIGCSRGANDGSQASPSDTQPSGARASGSGSTNVVMTAEDFSAEWLKNSKDVDKYKDEVLELTGTVEYAVDKGTEVGLDMGCVHLAAPGAPNGFPCFTTDKEPWLRVCSGSTVKIRGVVLEEFGDPVSSNACLWKLGQTREYKPRRSNYVTAEFAADLQKATAKYIENPEFKSHKKQLYLEGEVLEQPAETTAFKLLKLRGDGMWVIECHFIEPHRKKTASLMPGTKVKVLGEIDDSPEKNRLGLYTFAVIELP
jgi:hypothetical protein